MKILVIGDSCKDVFIYGKVNRLCPEAPVPVFIPQRKTETGGMAANVYENIESLEVEVDLHIGYDVTVNNEDKASFAADVATAVSGDRNVRIMDHPVMGAEDFSYVLNRVPGAMMFLGLMPEGMDIMKAAPNHSNRAIYEETQMRRGIAVYSSLALRHLGVPLS